MEVGNKVRIRKHIPRLGVNGNVIDLYGKIGTITMVEDILGGKYHAEIEFNIEGFVKRLYFNRSEFKVEKQGNKGHVKGEKL